MQYSMLKKNSQCKNIMGTERKLPVLYAVVLKSFAKTVKIKLKDSKYMEQ